MLASEHLYYADSLKMPKTGIHWLIDNDNLEWLKNRQRLSAQTQQSIEMGKIEQLSNRKEVEKRDIWQPDIFLFNDM